MVTLKGSTPGTTQSNRPEVAGIFFTTRKISKTGASSNINIGLKDPEDSKSAKFHLIKKY